MQQGSLKKSHQGSSKKSKQEPPKKSQQESPKKSQNGEVRKIAFFDSGTKKKRGSPTRGTEAVASVSFVGLPLVFWLHEVKKVL
jgi:hypothetical protein